MRQGHLEYSESIMSNQDLGNSILPWRRALCVLPFLILKVIFGVGVAAISDFPAIFCISTRFCRTVDDYARMAVVGVSVVAWLPVISVITASSFSATAGCYLARGGRAFITPRCFIRTPRS